MVVTPRQWFWCGAAGALLGFTLLTVVVLGFGLDGWDYDALREVARLHGTTLTTTMRAIAALGSAAWAVPLTVAAAAAALVLRRRRAAALVVLALAGAELLQLGLKAVFGRPRPSVFPPLEHIGNAAYPSGHALVSAAVAGALAIICWKSRWRPLAVTAAAVYVLAVGFSRLYLGVHYPSDVLAGWLLATAWVAALSALVGPLRGGDTHNGRTTGANEDGDAGPDREGRPGAR